MKNISFIEIRSPESNIFRRFPIPRVGAVLLSTILADRGHNVRVFIEDIARPDWRFIEKSDIVCISTITSTVHFAYAIADRLRKLGIIVVIGGAHTTFMPEEAMGHVDFVIRGEGDISLPALVDYIEVGRPSIETIGGLTYRNTVGDIVHNPQGEFVKDLDTLPLPNFGLVHKWKNSNILPIATSRGCAFDCRFCLVSPMFGRAYRFRSVESVMGELRKRVKVSQSPIFFVDDNFAANKKRTKLILQGMTEIGLKPRWSAMVRPDIAKDEELLRVIAKTGKPTVCIGFESINPEALKAYEKKQTLEDNITSIKKIKAHGIKIHGMFVFGSDTDTVETIHKTTEFATSLGIDSVQYMILTPLPGTKVYDDFIAENRLLHTDWSKYDIHHVVYKPVAITANDLHFETLKAMRGFYSVDYILRRMSRLDLFYGAFGIYSRSVIGRAIKNADACVDGLCNLKSAG
ncbi:MAG: B12-binding domain-containing radical SAM protein [Candidatus Magnetominusculus sp. LBB02]|nr:B12-binding domain-containing radical SAM protein [Candidatus Magnetominusculus sp. LBB02]